MRKGPGTNIFFQFLKIVIVLNFVCLSVLLACMCTYHVQVCLLWGPEEGTESLGTRVTGSCEPPGGCWEPKLGPSVRAANALNR